MKTISKNTLPPKALLVAAGIRQRTIATALGVSDTSVSEVLKGKRMSQRIRAEIATRLGKSVNQLWPTHKRRAINKEKQS